MSAQDLYEAEDEMDDEVDRLAVPKMTPEPGATKNLPGVAALLAALSTSWTRAAKLFDIGGLRGGGGGGGDVTAAAALASSTSDSKQGGGSAISSAAVTGRSPSMNKGGAGKGGFLNRLWGSPTTPPAAGA